MSKALGWIGIGIPTPLLSTLFALLPLAGAAQNAVQWTTNFYTVTGETLPEVHQSLRQKRPWGDRVSVDGMTEWQLEWRFTFTSAEGGCRLSSFATKTIIFTTLPRWNAPAGASPLLRNSWSNYLHALALHEAGHAAIAFAAAAELQKQAKTNSAGADCSTLQQNLNALGQRVLEEYRRRDDQYDERTAHGATQGARLPFGRRELPGPGAPR